MRILSIDGGGIRGLIPATVLVEVERLLRERTDDPDTRLADHFDLVAGTSTGGLIACMLLLPDDDGRPVHAAPDIVDFYRRHGSTLFHRSFGQRVRRTGALLDERYGSEGFRAALDDGLGGRDARLSQLLRPTVIPSFNATTGDPYFFKQQWAAAGGRNFSVRDVAMATAAAPTVFETARVPWGEGEEAACVDGGVFANNPTMCAYAEGHGFFGYGARDMAILSLGTGDMLQTYRHRDMRNWGVLRWVGPLMDMMLSGSSRTVDHQIRQIFGTLGSGAVEEQYVRVQTDLSEEPSSVTKMDNVKPTNIERLIAIGRRVAAQHQDRIEAFIDTQLLGPPERGATIDLAATDRMAVDEDVRDG